MTAEVIHGACLWYNLGIYEQYGHDISFDEETYCDNFSIANEIVNFLVEHQEELLHREYHDE
ncbi:MAG: hypothetical protein J6A15_00515 [Clostridia bacterium]|nr:hypothetical protein [Clostridia bacterium]